MLRNTDQSYGSISKTLHWVMALIILGLLSVGFFMSAMAFSPLKLEIYGIHKSFGMIVLMLVGVRVLWKGLSHSPRHLDSHAKWERVLAKFIHCLLYVAMIGMPLSGWLMSSAGEFPNIFFGLFEFPALTGKDEALFKLMRNMHALFALMLIGIIGLHVAGAFKHHFIDVDQTLKRMTRQKLGFVDGAFLALIVVALLAIPAGLYLLKYVQTEQSVQSVQETTLEKAPERAASGWVIDSDASAIQFEVTQYGQPFTGGFRDFTGEIVFDSSNLEDAFARIEIDVASLYTGSDDRDEQARGGEWFDVTSHPKAVFEADQFRVRKANHESPNHYEARGSLTLRGVTMPLILPFTLDIDEASDGAQKAVMDASIILKRLDYGVGQGQWQATDAIGNDVILELHVEANQRR